jgi:hypothetical protein
MGLWYGRAGRVTAENGGLRPHRAVGEALCITSVHVSDRAREDPLCVRVCFEPRGRAREEDVASVACS